MRDKGVAPPLATRSPGRAAVNVAEDFPDFLDEAEEHAETIAQSVLGLEAVAEAEKPVPREKADAIMRDLHSIKSACTAFPELGQLMRTVHGTETLFTRVQSGGLPFTSVMVEILTDAVDGIRGALAQMRKAGRPVESDALLTLLEKFDILLLPAEPAEEPGARAAAAEAAAPPPKAEAPPAPEGWNASEYEELLPDFLQEANEIIERFSNDLVELENDRENAELINRIFRHAHTLKGSSGMVGLKTLEMLTHRAENRLDAIRKGREKVTPELMDALLLCLDTVKEMLVTVAERRPIHLEVSHLLLMLSGEGAGPAPRPSPPSSPTASAAMPSPPPPAATAAPQKDEATDRVPPDPSIGAKPSAARPDAAAQTLRVGIDKLDKVMNLVGELAINKIAFDEKLQNLTTGFEALRRSRRVSAGIGGGREASADLLGLEDDVEVHMTDLAYISDRLNALTTELQEGVMKTRMVPVSQVFNKFPRAVRDLSRATGKTLNLVIEGAETEIDKTVIEKIGDPLMHLVRNAADHGVEPAEDRARTGKPAAGLIRLAASQVGDHIQIEIEDDGAGIDPRKMRQSAVRKGLLTEEAAACLGDREALNLIFLPGFSTAAAVTDLSGRGVGMDVVRDNLEALKGSLEIFSEVGKGTLFQIKLPLTLAIIQVLLVRCADQVFAIPIFSIEENLFCRAEEVRLVGTHEVINLRGETLPLCRLETVLGLPPARRRRSGAGVAARQGVLPVIVVESSGTRIGLVVDEQVKKQEVVIRNLGTLLKKVRYAAGSTILGDGRVVLILDVPTLVKGSQAHRLPATVDWPSAAAAQRILVVEDSNVVRRRIAEIFREAAYEVDEAVDGSDGLEKAQRTRYDLVTIDVMMPGMDGYELTRRLRELPEYRTAPLVIISSKAEEVDKRRGFEAGVDDYVTKPFVQDQILTTIRKLLR